MLIEQSAYANRWRAVSPAAKTLFALGGFVAAFVAGQPGAAVVVGALIVVATLVGAGVPVRRYLNVALPPLGFLVLGGLSLALSLDAVDGHLVWRWLPNGWTPLLQLAARSGAALAALLFLALTTPMVDLIGLLRRLRVPETLLDLMALCYRMLFVFSESLAVSRTAQAARLGYSTARDTRRALAGLAANLTVQIWRRAQDLHMAAQARNNDGALRFLGPDFAHAGQQLICAVAGAVVLIAVAIVLR